MDAYAPWDMHLHLGWAADPAALAEGLAGAGGGALAVTVEPGDFRPLREAVGQVPSVLCGLGLHPWYVAADPAARAAQLEGFLAQVGETSYVGEVGLDFSARHKATADAQVEALTAILGACAPGTVVSLHSVAAAGCVLDLLEAPGVSPDLVPIFHWFSGTSEELDRARARGCWFSVGEPMVASRRGREYGRQVPLDRLLLETDLPAAPGDALGADGVAASLGRTLDALAAVRREPRDLLVEKTAASSRALLEGGR